MEFIRSSAVQLQQHLHRGDLSSVELVTEFLRVIEAREPQIGAFITIAAEQALEEAVASDKRRRQKALLSDWDGIPIAIKDNMSTAGLRTTCASKTLADYAPPFDASVIRRIKQAGLPILGKTNMDEFAMGSSTESSGFQITKNPWDTTRVPGGSSGGSAAAVAANEAPWALGSDTGGSIRQPAAFCGIVGLKPTYGMVSRYGVIAYASSLDQVGPLTTTVEDSAVLLSIIAGQDPYDATSLQTETPDFCGGLKEDGSNLVVGVPAAWFSQSLDPQVMEAVEHAVAILEGAGVRIKEIQLPHNEYALEAFYLIAPAEASSNLARFDGVRYGLRVDAEDTLRMFINTRSQGFGEEVKRRIMLGTYALSSGYYDAYYRKAQQVRTLIKRDYQQAFDQVDVIISPTSPTAAFAIGEKTDPVQMYQSDICTVPVNMAGLPAISIPCGLTKARLPIGVQLIGQAFAESALLRTAYSLERLLQREGQK